MVSDSSPFRTRRFWPGLLDVACLTTLIVAAAVCPLLVRGAVVPLAPAVAALHLGEPVQVDFFSFWKARMLVGCGVASVVCLAMLRRRGPALPRGVRVCLGVYAAGVLASAGFSDWPDIAWGGYPGRYEGGWVLLSYAVLTLLAARVAVARGGGVVVVALGVSAAVVGAVGLAQAAGHSPFALSAVQKLVAPTGPLARGGRLVIDPWGSAVASTLYNPNYVGSYMAMVGSLALAMGLQGGRVWTRVGWMGLSALSFANLVACGSRAGLVAAALATALAVLLAFRRDGWRSLGRVAAPIALAATITTIMAVTVSPDLTTAPWRRLAAEVQSLLVPGTGSLAVRHIVARGAEVRFETTRETLVLLHEDGRLGLADGRGKSLGLVPSGDGWLRVLDSHYDAYRLLVNPQNWLAIRRAGLPEFRFAWSAAGFRLLDPRGRPVETASMRPFPWPGRESVGAGRLGIWWGAWPLLWRTGVWGVGPDCFAAAYPQGDLVLKTNTHGRYDVVVDKPHNGYLQTAIQTGGLSLLAVLALVAGYGAPAFRQSAKRGDASALPGPIPAVLCGVVGYAVAAIFNDSVVSVAPVFWVLLGTGIGLNARAAQGARSDG
jgi:hypothetical protein